MGQICVFFGHRFIPNQSLVKAGLTDVILDLIRSKGVDEFWLGGYGDFDHLAFEVLRSIKKEHPTITRSLALAYLPTNQEDYDWKKSSYDHVFCPEGIEEGPLRFAICRRNKWLAQNADFVVCYVDTQSGGAYQAVRIAKSAGKTIINLANS